MKAGIQWYAIALTVIIGGGSLQAQVLRPVTPVPASGGGIWLSGPGITGDGAGVHSGETAILDMEDSVVNTVSIGAGGAGASVGKVVLGDLRIRKAVNANSFVFSAAVGKGTFLASLKFNYYQKDAVMLSVTLSDVIVSKYKLFSSDCAGNNCSGLYEEITLSFRQVQYADNAGHSTSIAK